MKSRSGREAHHVHTHSSGVVVSLQSKLASISQDFKSILEVRTEVSGDGASSCVGVSCDVITLLLCRV